MSTRSFIGKINKDLSITGIYCHFDGYIEHHAPIFNKHYLDESKVNKLISLGSLSILDIKIGSKQDFNYPKEGCCLAYHRDRGDPFRQLKYNNIEDALDNIASECGARYAYIFNGKDWDIYEKNKTTWNKYCSTQVDL